MAASRASSAVRPGASLPRVAAAAVAAMAMVAITEPT